MPVFATLKITWAGRGLCLAFQKHCTRVPMQVMATVSPRDISAMPIRPNRKQTDMVLGIPGRLTFMPAARVDRAR